MGNAPRVLNVSSPSFNHKATRSLYVSSDRFWMSSTGPSCTPVPNESEHMGDTHGHLLPENPIAQPLHCILHRRMAVRISVRSQNLFGSALISPSAQCLAVDRDRLAGSHRKWVKDFQLIFMHPRVVLCIKESFIWPCSRAFIFSILLATRHVLFFNY